VTAGTIVAQTRLPASLRFWSGSLVMTTTRSSSGMTY
jgi:hypothetical protein